VTGGRLQRDRPRLTLGERSIELGQPVNDPPLQLVPGLGLGHVNGLSTAAERLDGSSVEGVLAGVLPPRPIEIPRRLQRSFAFGGAGAHRHRPLLGRQQLPRLLEGHQPRRRGVSARPARLDLALELCEAFCQAPLDLLVAPGDDDPTTPVGGSQGRLRARSSGPLAPSRPGSETPAGGEVATFSA